MCVECAIWWVLANTLAGGGGAGSSCYLAVWRSKPSERTSGVREIKIKEGGKKTQQRLSAHGSKASEDVEE